MQYLRKEERLKKELSEEFGISRENIEEQLEKLEENYMGRVSEYDMLKIIKRDYRLKYTEDPTDSE